MSEKWKSFDAVLVTEALFDRVARYTSGKKLITSNYDHGHGVSRSYTLKYCLQHNYGQTPGKYYIRRDGRSPSKTWILSRTIHEARGLDGLSQWASLAKQDQIIAELDAETPSYDSLLNNIMRKCPGDVIRIYKKSPSSGSFGAKGDA